MKFINLTLSFLLEIAMLASLCYWGFTIHGTLLLHLTLGICIPAILIIFWSVYLAPNGKRRAKLAAGSVTSSVLFICAAAVLSSTGQELTALIIAVVSIANLVLKIAWKQW